MTAALSPLRSKSLLFIHIFVIVLSGLLVALITYDCLANVTFVTNELYLKYQFWICILFILSIVAEMIVRRHMKVWEWISHFIFILVCVPYLSIFTRYDIHPSPQMWFIFRVIPMIRAAYALSIVSGAMTKGWIKSLFFTYLMILIFSVYFGSLMFYIEEHYVNPGIGDYWSALYWTCMDLTTCGSAINAITPTGKVIAVMLAAEGLMLFPVFTVYVTDAVTHQPTATT